MKNEIEIIDVEDLLASVDDGTNRLVINGSEIDPSEWTGSGTYSTTVSGHPVYILKVSDLNGNIGIRRTAEYTYQLYKHQSGGGDIPALADLTDTNINNPSNGQVLKHNGSEWENDNLALADLSDDSTHRLVTDTEKNTWNGKVSDNPSFSEAGTRSNIASGESFATILGKIKKFFSDLKTVAFTGAYSDLSGTPSLATVATSGSFNDLTNKPFVLKRVSYNIPTTSYTNGVPVAFNIPLQSVEASRDNRVAYMSNKANYGVIACGVGRIMIYPRETATDVSDLMVRIYYVE